MRVENAELSSTELSSINVHYSMRNRYLPDSNSVTLGSVRSTGMKSLSQVMVGSGLPVALHSITVLRSFSTALSVGLSVIRGYPLGTISEETRSHRPRKLYWIKNSDKNASHPSEEKWIN